MRTPNLLLYNNSEIPPTLNAITGQPQAKLSIIVFGELSYLLGTTETLAAEYNNEIV